MFYSEQTVSDYQVNILVKNGFKESLAEQVDHSLRSNFDYLELTEDSYLEFFRLEKGFVRIEHVTFEGGEDENRMVLNQWVIKDLNSPKSLSEYKYYRKALTEQLNNAPCFELIAFDNSVIKRLMGMIIHRDVEIGYCAKLYPFPSEAVYIDLWVEIEWFSESFKLTFLNEEQQTNSDFAHCIVNESLEFKLH